MGKKIKVIKKGMITVNFKEKEPTTIKWIICKHCKKTVYGIKTEIIGEPEIITKWEWKPKRKRKKK